jgi:hypothetical protein
MISVFHRNGKPQSIEHVQLVSILVATQAQHAGRFEVCRATSKPSLRTASAA